MNLSGVHSLGRSVCLSALHLRACATCLRGARFPELLSYPLTTRLLLSSNGLSIFSFAEERQAKTVSIDHQCGD
ncbi:hypothetical protein F5B22DRAFT_592968 [Xylaria bambusicola]|uniref:uncharacterized protein n=1 Tax=Xylaria bambusicola TaxID=326684 RepID=UPI002008AFC6|nr:uncharacterized protein F5B22DRAFT_592968 [Xylaria bambusicola]KAI0522148.1 hypothetical protein F5B22DRAFT_592968 [Xylaria bambusicola]